MSLDLEYECELPGGEESSSASKHLNELEDEIDLLDEKPANPNVVAGDDIGVGAGTLASKGIAGYAIAIRQPNVVGEGAAILLTTSNGETIIFHNSILKDVITNK